MKSVLQDWVMNLPLRHQGTLLTSIRGCDLQPKEFDNGNFIDSQPRRLVAFLRYCILNPADDREIDISGAFFQSQSPESFKASSVGHLPLHWYSHIMHTAEIIAYKHPKHDIQIEASNIYIKMVKNLHLNIETEIQMDKRLTEDRIENDTVVT